MVDSNLQYERYDNIMNIVKRRLIRTADGLLKFTELSDSAKEVAREELLQEYKMVIFKSTNSKMTQWVKRKLGIDSASCDIKDEQVYVHISHINSKTMPLKIDFGGLEFASGASTDEVSEEILDDWIEVDNNEVAKLKLSPAFSLEHFASEDDESNELFESLFPLQGFDLTQKDKFMDAINKTLDKMNKKIEEVNEELQDKWHQMLDTVKWDKFTVQHNIYFDKEGHIVKE